MKTLTFLLSTVIELYTMVVLLQRLGTVGALRLLQPVFAVCGESHAADCRTAAPDYPGNGAD